MKFDKNISQLEDMLNALHSKPTDASLLNQFLQRMNILCNLTILCSMGGDPQSSNFYFSQAVFEHSDFKKKIHDKKVLIDSDKTEKKLMGIDHKMNYIQSIIPYINFEGSEYSH